MRAHPRSIEAVLRILTQICEAPDSTTAERLRAAELILCAHGRLTLPPDQLPRRNGLKSLVNARLDLSETDRKIAGQARKERKQRSLRLKAELEKL